jgi:uncharacterized membrane protein YdjX (TVP38/TMEM64 family)
MLWLWIGLLATALSVYFFKRDALQHLMASLADSPPFWAYWVYLILGCVRGFTLIPATYLVVAGMVFLAPVPLFLLTLAGIIVSSAAVYYFADAMQFDRLFERRYGPQIDRLRGLLVRRQLPIVITWSFFPLAPTDVVCYVCGALKIGLSRCLLGVAIGEGAICAVYIFVGTRALGWMR